MNQSNHIPLISRQVLFGNPDKDEVKISPDGSKISYLAPVGGVLNVWVGPIDDPGAAKPVSNDTERGIRFYRWAFTNSHILYIQDKGGDENWRLYRVDLNSNETKDLTPLDNVQSRFQQVSNKFPDEILIGLNDRDPEQHDIYRLNIITSERQLVLENEGFFDVQTDENFNVRLAARMTSDGGIVPFEPANDGSWRLAESVGPIAAEDAMTTYPIGFDKTGQTLFQVDSRGRNTAALTTINLENGAQTVLAENGDSDVSGVMLHPTQKHVQAVAFTYTRKQWQILDDDIGADIAYLRSVTDGDIEVVSRALDDNVWVVRYEVDTGPARFYRYDRAAGQTHFLFTNRQNLEGIALATMQPVVIQSRDGLDLVSYYTLPIDSDPQGNGQPNAPLPMVLLVHGGPWARDVWGYNAGHQWLANRGYAVLSVNFRSSTGFGKAFINAGDGEWAAKTHNDLLDAVNWAVEAGIADPDRIAIMGGSFGGYATLVGLTFTPEIFACGIDIVGPSNLVTLLETMPPYWMPQAEIIFNRVGDPRTEEGRVFLSERSPLTYADRIKRPLLIGQGANDPRVKQAEADQIIEAMRTNDIPVTYLLYPDEGHGFARPENRLSFNAVTEAFLAGCLEGRCEPIGQDFDGSTITVPVGAGTIPGLGELFSNG